MTITDTEKEGQDRNRQSGDSSVDVQAEAESTLDTKIGLQPAPKLEPISVPEGNEVPPEYISGFRLFLVTGIVALVSFTMLLDTSIIVTVSCIPGC